MSFCDWGSTGREAFRAVNAMMAEANTELTAHGMALAGDSWRSYQEALRTRSTLRTTIRPSYNQQPVRSRSDNPVTTKTCGRRVPGAPFLCGIQLQLVPQCELTPKAFANYSPADGA